MGHTRASFALGSAFRWSCISLIGMLLSTTVSWTVWCFSNLCIFYNSIIIKKSQQNVIWIIFLLHMLLWTRWTSSLVALSWWWHLAERACACSSSAERSWELVWGPSRPRPAYGFLFAVFLIASSMFLNTILCGKLINTLAIFLPIVVDSANVAAFLKRKGFFAASFIS